MPCAPMCWLYQIGSDPADLAAPRDIARWLTGFHARADRRLLYQPGCRGHAGPTLHGDVFYARTDAERRAGPQPPIDRNAYARENGWAIASLAALYDVTGEPALIDAAVRAFDWALAQRRAPNGGFGHARAGRRRHPSRRHAVDGRGRARALSQHRRAALPQRCDRARRGDRARSSRSVGRLHGACARSPARRACWPSR